MIRYNLAFLGATAATSFVAGGIAGYIYAKKKLKAYYDALVENELADALKFYKKRRAKEEKKAKKEKAEQALEDYNPGLEEFTEDDGNPYNLEWDPEDLDYEEEMKHRSDEAPYVISKNEFAHDKPQYAKVDLEYYREDEVLIDGGLDPFTDIGDLVGADNLKRFGHGSGDRRMVYIRNEELETDFEIHMMMGSYAIDILGLDDPQDKGRHERRTVR